MTTSSTLPGSAPRARPRELGRPAAGVPLLGSALSLQRDMLGFLEAIDRAHGPMASFRVGPARWVLASRADAIEDVLVGRGEDFDKPDALYGHGRMIFGNALTGLKGARWRARRSIVAPAFHRQPLDAHAITGFVAAWVEQAGAQSEVKLGEQLTRVMTRVTCANLLDGAHGEHAAAAAGAALGAMGTRANFGVPLPDWLPLRPVSTMRRAVTELERFFDAAVRVGEGRERADLRTALEALRGEDGERLLDYAAVRAEINVMVAVGGHQLALALAWALYLLDTNPQALDSLTEELDRTLGERHADLTDLDGLTFTGQVIDETLRIYPPFYLIGREALRDTLVAGWQVPRGTTVVLSPWVTQRLPEYFERPGEFRPQRWTAQLRRELPRAAYFPFGGGGRLCVAQAASRRQLMLALATIVSRCRVRFDHGRSMRPRTTTSLEQPRGVLVRVETRR
ncbi:MAG TPA: cytochrome P450 [Solirubrobacteraceae bacterium]|nr:cytochrome P450 [Solirubrobacteraceae bacterium]